MRVIETAYPEKHWDKLEMMLPDWKDIGESPRFRMHTVSYFSLTESSARIVLTTLKRLEVKRGILHAYSLDLIAY